MTATMNAVETKTNQEAKNWPQILAIITAGISTFNYGLLFGWPSPATTQLMSEEGEFKFTLEQCSYFNVISAATSALTTLIFAKLSDTIGRKFTILTMAVTQSASFLLAAFAKNVYVFYASRIFCGLSDACVYVAVPAYIGEISTPKVRDSWGNTLCVYAYVGEAVVSAVAGYSSIQNGSLICLSFPLLFAITFSLMPESPYYLLMKKRNEQAYKTLQKLQRLENVDTEIKQLESDVNRQMSERGTWKDLFLIRSNRKALFAGIFLRTSQQLSGCTVWIVYTEYIFKQADSNMSITDSAIIFLSALAVCIYFAGYFFNKIGKKRALKYSSALSSLVLAAVGIYFYILLQCPHIDVSNVKWIPLAGMLLYLPVFAMGMGIAPTFMLSELFSASIKSKGLCALTIYYGCLQCLISKLFPILEVNFGMYTPFGVFAVCTFASTFLVDYFVPETKGMTLEEIQQQLKDNKKAES